MENMLLRVLLSANLVPHWQRVFLCKEQARGVTGSMRRGSHGSFRQDEDVSGGV